MAMMARKDRKESECESAHREELQRLKDAQRANMKRSEATWREDRHACIDHQTLRWLQLMRSAN